MHRSCRLIAIKFGCVAVLASALVACGDEGGSAPIIPASTGGTTQTGASTGTGASNAAPTIQGQASSSIVVGRTYTFQPTASDPNQDRLTFSVTNLPSWASFDASTGRISGTPTEADVATVTGISVTVTDGTATATLGPFSIAVAQAGSGSALLSWMPPARNTDGSTLLNLAGYRVLYGSSATALTEAISIPNPSLSSYLVENLTPGTWYFAVVAVNSLGVTSNFSEIASKTIR